MEALDISSSQIAEMLVFAGVFLIVLHFATKRWGAVKVDYFFARLFIILARITIIISALHFMLIEEEYAWGFILLVASTALKKPERP